MEIVLCNVHGTMCMLKTGIKDGPNKGKSFYVCVDTQGCDFSQQASMSPSHCLLHEDSMVELQALSYSQQQQSHMLFYRCSVGKKMGQRWCGKVPWIAVEKETRTPLSDKQLQPSTLPQVRNPFKAPSKTAEDSEWRKMQSQPEERAVHKKHCEVGCKVEEKERYHKDSVEAAGAGVGNREEEGRGRTSDTYQSKLLPLGKKISSEDSCTSKPSSVDKVNSKIQDKAKEKPAVQDKAEKNILIQNIKVDDFKKTSQSSPDLGKNVPQKPACGETCSVNQSERTLQENSIQISRDTDCVVLVEMKSKHNETHKDDDVLFVSATPAIKKSPPISTVQKSITSFPGFKSAAHVGNPKGMHSLLSAQLQQKKTTLSSVNVAALPDKGERLKTQVKELEDALESLSLAAAAPSECVGESDSVISGVGGTHLNPFSRQGGTILLPYLPVPSPFQHQVSDPQMHTYYGGRMTSDRLLEIKNATCEAIDHLHKSLESSPDPEAEAPDPSGIKVSLLPHQRRALAWLLWREAQNPCGGILADDMGLGKTLTMIALILAKKMKAEEKKIKANLEPWLTKSDSDIVASKSTLIICPASLIHHWKNEIDRHVKRGKLTVYLYHGTNREKSARVFLRCSPFDEYKLWKAQVDNGSLRGRERLNILTRSLLLRRTKDQLDVTGKPLVLLPNRTCEVHKLKLCEDEQVVYNVLFAQSRSTLQKYLKRHEGNDLDKGNSSVVNPFDKVAQEFSLSQAAPTVSSSQQPSSTVHILSLLLRLRQCCCHLSLLKKTLDSSELQGDGVVLSLEEQLNALSLSSSPSPSGPNSKDTVALNGTCFSSQLFEESSKSTKISAITSELIAVREKSDNQKSVIVSQWTSMLNIVAVHLRQMGFRYSVIDGTVNPKRRMDLVEEFNTNPRGPQVMLVSLCAGGVGLNLIGGNHLFLMDMHWNPALEDQACDRIYRVGQRRDVTIHRFVCEGTVEEKISLLQIKKKELAQNVLSGKGSTVSKLSLADLKIIFGV